MAVLKFQQAFQQLSQKKREGTYFVVGDENFQFNELKQALKKMIVPQGEDETFSYERYYADSIDLSSLRSSLQSEGSLFDMGAEKLVVLTGLERATQPLIDVLVDYLQSPSETTCLLLAATKLDKRKALYKELAKKAAIVEVQEPYEREWPAWQRYLQQRLGKKVDPKAFQLLIDGANRNLARVWTDLQQVATFLGDAKEIGVEQVSAFARLSGTSHVFTFIDEVVARDRARSIQSYQKLKRSGEQEIKLLALLIRQFRLLAQYQRGGSQLSLPSFVAKKVAQQAQRHNPTRVNGVLDQLAECDYRIKTGRGNLFDDFLVPYFQPGA